jgi:CheY-like chemotaxis protein
MDRQEWGEIHPRIQRGAPAGAPMTAGSAKRVLIAEDDRFLRKACETGLRQRGFAVLTAVDGNDALHVARTERPDLMLLDLLMPKRSGLEVLRELKADPATRDIPVLVFSNSSRDADVDEVHALGAVGYVVKANLSLKELGDQVTSLLGAQR